MNKKNTISDKKTFFVFISFVMVMAYGSSAFSYVMTGAQILEQVSSKLGRTTDLIVSQKIILYDDQFENGSMALSEIVFFKKPDLFRSEIALKDTKKIHLSSFEQAIIILDGKITAEFESGFDHYKDLFVIKEREKLQKRLNLLGINTRSTRLERYDGRIVYVIGDRPEAFGETPPQIYIDKENFLPVRWILRGTQLAGENTEPLEIHYFDWKRYNRVMMPEYIEFYKNDILVREVRIEKVKKNRNADESLFDFELLKKEFTAVEPDKDHDENEKKDETSKVIEGLDKIIEDDRLAF